MLLGGFPTGTSCDAVSWRLEIRQHPSQELSIRLPPWTMQACEHVWHPASICSRDIMPSEANAGQRGWQAGGRI
ncbi:hypothetical protein B0T16DRAFT_418499 [Cercophora newfieldiana]|uniref:Uncharacterized protein n=1 Tax=Cercophora newfieldiana TaxID=92897 RepID=A0AA40CJ46_9PEZI|nr:hypothetical protein B0T16DRAFT_418499 [Cercophora newfieldiana]